METVVQAAEPDPILARTAGHEAGHALAACVLAIPFARVALGEAGESAGRVVGIVYPDETRLDRRAVEDFLVYLAAGSAAVELLHGRGVVSGGTEDRLQAEYWAARAFPRPLDYRRNLAVAKERARALLGERRAALETVAAALLERRELAAAEVRRLVDSPGALPDAG
jgi:ATP-dependent Zn protease